MQDDRARLQRLLSELRTQLANIPTIDAEARSRLELLLADLEQMPSEPSTMHPQAASLAEIATDFETSHPNLAAALGSIIDALARMGI
jgi:hypothetical protein